MTVKRAAPCLFPKRIPNNSHNEAEPREKTASERQDTHLYRLLFIAAADREARSGHPPEEEGSDAKTNVHTPWSPYPPGPSIESA